MGRKYAPDRLGAQCRMVAPLRPLRKMCTASDEVGYFSPLSAHFVHRRKPCTETLINLNGQARQTRQIGLMK